MSSTRKESHQSRRYYPRLRDQRGPFIFMCVVLVVSLVYALGLRDPMTRALMLVLSGILSLVIATTLLQALRRYNHTDLDDAGIHTTQLRFIHRHILWPDIAKLEKTSISKTPFIGINFTDEFAAKAAPMAKRGRSFGWDALVPEAFDCDGAPLSDAAVAHYTKRLKS